MDGPNLSCIGNRTLTNSEMIHPPLCSLGAADSWRPLSLIVV
jgi:hypothetical protein